MPNTSDIQLKVLLDDQKVPEKISWIAKDSGVDEDRACNAFLLSIWDPKENNTLRIDLWTKDMLVDDMKQFYHQTLITMAETFERATGETRMKEQMLDFADYFAEKMGLKE
ncbi:MAG: gliding motility protein GldC [Bacteroidia bacterium]|nr:gliding motility protein GldC [Bacteroidia bacterium]